MSQSVSYHLYVPSGTGNVDVHIHFGDKANGATPAEILDSPTLNNPTEIDPKGPEAMLARFKAFDLGTQAGQVYDAALDTGWEALTPEPRTAKAKSEAAYIRFRYLGTKHRAIAYVNTNSLFATGVKEKAVLSQLPFADVRTDVYVSHLGSNLQQALEALETLRRWADGEEV